LDTIKRKDYYDCVTNKEDFMKMQLYEYRAKHYTIFVVVVVVFMKP